VIGATPIGDVLWASFRPFPILDAKLLGEGEMHNGSAPRRSTLRQPGWRNAGEP
jgi:hypothetical protein